MAAWQRGPDFIEECYASPWIVICLKFENEIEEAWHSREINFLLHAGSYPVEQLVEILRLQ
jgi:hypothetical protein